MGSIARDESIKHILVRTTGWWRRPDEVRRFLDNLQVLGHRLAVIGWQGAGFPFVRLRQIIPNAGRYLHLCGQYKPSTVFSHQLSIHSTLTLALY
jgi:hypothetical protein